LPALCIMMQRCIMTTQGMLCMAWTVI
jgi:hypothetical protein